MNHFAFVLVVLLTLTATCPSPSEAARASALTLAVRLNVGDEASSAGECWKSLMELQACSGEVITFFMNGETYLGPTCCNAIHVIAHHCWPAIFGSVGFTADEADILLGFCDAAAAAADSSDDTPPPLAPQSVVSP